MLLVTADVENVLVEFHHTPIASEGECYGRLLREWHSDFGDEVQRLALISSRLHLWVSRSNAKSALRIRDYSYVAGPRPICIELKISQRFIRLIGDCPPALH